MPPPHGRPLRDPDTFKARFGWEGRDIRLEDQVLMPVVHTREMGGEWPVIVARLKRDAAVVTAFADAFRLRKD